jgi:thiazole synthase ThiGH ThiG subunit
MLYRWKWVDLPLQKRPTSLEVYHVSNISAQIDGVREVTPEVAAQLRTKGVIADFQRDQVLVHVGKPVGSVTGYVGPLFYQVWVDRSDAPGVVHARIAQTEAETWALDVGLSKEQLLETAKDRIVAQAQAVREAKLASARAELSALEAA